jgi:antitoxin (DNA-binding transcriptional repressor) of toxin-antitoxin stability system
MQYLNIREMRNILGKLDQMVEEQQELIITLNKQEIARILAIQPRKKTSDSRTITAINTSRHYFFG